MPGFEPFRDLTEAERKVWEDVKRGSRGAADRAGYAGKESAKQLIQDAQRADRDRAAEGGRGD